MATTHVELVTPQRNLFSGEAEMVTCRTSGGDIAFLADVAEPAADIDVARAQQAREDAERRLASGNDPDAEAALHRAQARVEAAGG